jgi:peptide/nickel transport system substrate-binding protein
MRQGAVLTLVLCAVACTARQSASSGESGGTLVISTTADPGTLFPPLMMTGQAKQITEQIYDYLADVGPELNTRGDRGFRPQLTDGWRWSSDSLSLAFHINPRARWQDGKAANAHDVQFTFSLYRNPALGGGTRSELGNIDSVTTRDSLTAVFWFHRRLPTQFLDAAAQMLILPAHQLEGVAVRTLRESPPPPIGTGRFRLRRWDKGSSVEIVADSSNYRGRPGLDRVIWTIAPDFTTAVTKLFGGDADLVEQLAPNNVMELSRHPTLRAIVLPGTDYAFLRFNLRDPRARGRPHPLFGNRSLRRAITLALDREALVRSIFDTLAAVAVGPTSRAFPTTDPHLAQLPFDSAHARLLLDSLGWAERDSRGIRTMKGRELAFSLIVPVSSQNRRMMAVLIQAQLARAGIRVDIEQMESAAATAREAAHNFDATLGAWHLGASPDGTWEAWSSAGARKDGVNYGTYENPVFDAQLDSAIQADPAHAREKFSLAYSTINEDAPAVWLYDPKSVIGIHRRFRTGWLRADAWWADLGSWHILPAERLQRDLIKVGR